MEQKLVNLTINGKALQAPAGTTVFQAAAQAGIVIPHYCYHEDLSIAGVCRMCMVEVEKQPRLTISCNTQVAEGMVVHTNTEKVQASVKSTLELHLINHPLDCPICDKAGECKLQDYYADYGLYASRMEYEKVHKPKAVDIGTIVLDAERCILCTRCVRFTAEVTKSNELGIFNRGDRSELATYDNGPLTNEYTGNLADICPVGALTAKDFRFECRVWFLNKTDSVCSQCAQGCNTTISVNAQTDKLYRVEPRRNPDVNKSWICDKGRWDYHYVTKETRLQVPKVHVDGVWQDVTWHEVFGNLAAEIKKSPDEVLIALSTQLTNEEIWSLVSTLRDLKVENFTWVVQEEVVDDKEPYDGILKRRDVTPNANGFRQVMKSLKQDWISLKDAAAKVQKGKFSRVLVLGLEGESYPGLSALIAKAPKETKIAVHATNYASFFEVCDYILPNTSAYEKSGTFINAEGRFQKLNSAIPRQFTSRGGADFAWGVKQGNDRVPSPTLLAQQIYNENLRKLLPESAGTFRDFAKMGISLRD